MAELVKEPGVLDVDYSLIGEAGGELNLFIREGFDARSANAINAYQSVVAKQRNAERRAVAGDLLPFTEGVFRILQYIRNVDGSTLQRGATGRRAAARREWVRSEEC